MKKIGILFVAMAMFACSGNQGYTIKINMPEFAGNNVVLKQNVDGEMVSLDSVVLDSLGAGVISGKIKAPEMMYLATSANGRSLALFMDNFNYTVSGSNADVSIEADGGPQVEFNAYKESMKEFSEKQQEIVARYRMAEEAGMSQDSLEMIIGEYEEINDNRMAYDSSYIAENPTVIALYLMRGMFYQLSEEELEQQLSNFDESLHKAPYYIFLNDHLQRMKNVRIGEKYVDFELPDTEGNPVKLSDYAEKGVLLIDFWASWCGPCRRANPGVVKIYNEFKDKGFDIVGVSLDNSKDKWLEAIEADSLTWNHMSDVKGWKCEGAKLYAVAAIPATVLLDAEGTIIAKNLSEDELHAKLTELLGE